MASLKNIKLKILSVKKTSTVTKAMEAVSAVKMRKAQERALSSRLYAAAALSVLERISGSADIARHPLLQTRTGKTAIIVITSDKGLAGSLNSSVIRKVEQLIAQKNLSMESIVMFGIGRRGADYFANRDYDMRAKYENFSDGASELDVRAITDKLLAAHATGEISEAYIVYTNFVSTFEQEAISRQIVPVSQKVVTEIIEGIRPARGKYAPREGEKEALKNAPYTVEPEIDIVLEVLLPKLINIAVFHGLLESKASEHSARMVAMKNATDNARERVKQYTRTFNKVRQAAITREISEITSGIEAMR